MGPRWRFGPFEFDDERYELRCDGEPIELRRKVFDVLRYLLVHHDRLVTKEELMSEVWPGVVVQEAVITQNVAILRKLLGDSRKAATLIQTVHGRGYRFVADVVAGDAPRSDSRAAPRAAGDSFVGRDHVMRELGKLLEEARTGRGRLAVITGDAGIGKTRTSEALGAEARARRMRLFTARCHEGAGAPAYWPWIQILRAAAADAPRGAALGARSDARALKLLSALQPERAEVVPRHTSPAAADARFRLFDDLTSWLAELARAEPLLVTLDDLHWADEATLLLLRFLAREVRGLPLLVLATSRGIDVRSTPETGPLAALLRETHAERIYLTGLSLAATGDLVAAVLGRELAPERVRELHALSEGNPFFLKEILQLFADDTSGAADEERFRRELPRRLREVIALRMRALGPGAERVLTQASVIGGEFDVAVLDQVSEQARAQVLESLGSAVSARIVREASGPPSEASRASIATGRYAFSHALIRESLYGALAESERVRLHDRVGRAIEARFGEDAGPHLDEIAHHAYLAAAGGDVGRAVKACVQAAEHALATLAFERAVLHYDRARSALLSRLSVDDEARFSIELALGAAQFRAGEDGNPSLARAAECARRRGRPEGIAEVALAMCGWPRVVRHGRTANPALEPLIEEALAARLDDYPVLRARLLAAWALNGPLALSIEDRVALAEEAIRLARSAGDDEAFFDALVGRLRLPQSPEHTRARVGIADELVAVAQRLGERERVFAARALRVGPLVALGDLDRADEDIAACAALADELRLPHATLQVLRFRLERAFGDGRFDELRPLSRQAALLRGSTQVTEGTAVVLYIWPTFARVFRADRSWFDRNIGELAKAVDFAPSMRGFVAYLYAAFDCLAEARACYAPLLEPNVLDAARDDDWLMTFALVADAIVACGDREAAGAVYSRLLPHRALNVSHEEWLIYLGSCGYWLGALAALLGEHDAAREHFEAALEMDERLGARPALARTSLALARAILDAAPSAISRADRARALGLLRDATLLAEDLGMRRVADEARARAG